MSMEHSSNNSFLDELIERAEMVPYSKAASQLWSQAVVTADELLDSGVDVAEELLYCLIQLQYSYYSSGDATRVVAPFLRTQKLYETRPDLFHEERLEGLAWGYRYAFSALLAVPEVPVNQLRDLLDQAHALYKQIGDSRRALFQLEYTLAEAIGDEQAAEEAHGNWLNAEHTPISNCPACDPEVAASYHFDRGEWEHGIAVAEQALATDEMTCSAQPHSLFTHLIEPYAMTGQFDKAWNAHVQSYRAIKNDPAMLGALAVHIRVLAELGAVGMPGCTERSVELFCTHLPWWINASEPRELLGLASAGAVALGHLPTERGGEVLNVVLPGEQLPWQQAPTLHSPTVQQAKQWCADLAFTLARRFDARPGILQPRAVARLERNLQASGQGLPQPTAASLDRSGLKATVLAGFTELEELPSLKDVVEDPWRQQLTVEQLLEEHKRIGFPLNSYALRLEHLGVPAPYVEVQDYPDGLDMLKAHLLLRSDHLDAAYNQAMAVMLRESALTSGDPIGLRISGLMVLTNVHFEKEEYLQGLWMVQQTMNLAADAGLGPYALNTARGVLGVLMAMERWDAACALAENARMIAGEHRFNADGCVVAQIYADALGNLGQAQQAAAVLEEFLAYGDLADGEDGAIELEMSSQLANYLGESGQLDRALEVVDQVIKQADALSEAATIATAAATIEPAAMLAMRLRLRHQKMGLLLAALPPQHIELHEQLHGLINERVELVEQANVEEKQDIIASFLMEALELFASLDRVDLARQTMQRLISARDAAGDRALAASEIAQVLEQLPDPQELARVAIRLVGEDQGEELDWLRALAAGNN
ncbi:hypothetical protein NQ024_07215 [Corynebacterium sp. 35RC1]|nr:hypothetical protein [Corynebacterium sp. 35RC1]